MTWTRNCNASHPPFRNLAVLGSIDDDELLAKICSQHHPEMLYLPAAYKHVPLMESNPSRWSVTMRSARIAWRVRLQGIASLMS